MARILIADDDQHTCRALGLMLQADGHEVFEAPDGEGALRLANRHDIDFFLCDLFMPDRVSLETMRCFHAAYPDVPVVAVNGSACLGLLDSVA
jgi:twitching motility two-component system response regulator PilH